MESEKKGYKRAYRTKLTRRLMVAWGKGWEEGVVRVWVDMYSLLYLK